MYLYVAHGMILVSSTAHLTWVWWGRPAIKIKFSVKGGVEKWYKGTVTSYDGRSGKYGAYFPCDKQTVCILPDDPDIDCTN